MTARFDLKLDPDDKALLSRAAAAMGTTMAGFVRAAAKEKAQEVIERETLLRISEQDFVAFAAALDQGFRPNAALQRALDEAGDIASRD